ncbi:hypothetical protein A7A09_008880 [Paracoccus methylarcula]|uniref:Uncharacterized protein n=2 Tax=Paracoccus methylarcula TaxID=72022 RepID=A0A3R7NCR0_9RHOB|nr:hypothetical protein A7A09_008880 [Paracoccus methylarcula]
MPKLAKPAETDAAVRQMNEYDSGPYSWKRMQPEAITEHPITESDARTICRSYVGMGCEARFRQRHIHENFRRCREAWWDCLRAASAPEVRLSCERMINNINLALGLHLHDQGAELARRNHEQREREKEASHRAAVEAAEAAAIDRWR